MPLGHFQFLRKKNETWLVKYQDTVYKIKILYDGCEYGKDIQGLSQQTGHCQIEQVISRAVLYMDERDVVFQDMLTEHFLVTPKKRIWNASGKLGFKKNEYVLKVYPFMFMEMKVQLRKEALSRTIDLGRLILTVLHLKIQKWSVLKKQRHRRAKKQIMSSSSSEEETEDGIDGNYEKRKSERLRNQYSLIR